VASVSSDKQWSKNPRSALRRLPLLPVFFTENCLDRLFVGQGYLLFAVLLAKTLKDVPPHTLRTFGKAVRNALHW
jgi:hypothetical protein